jgi:hypothetical protein
MVYNNQRIALSKGPNIVGVSLPSPEHGNRFRFRNGVLSIYLEFRMTVKVQKPNDSERFNHSSQERYAHTVRKVLILCTSSALNSWSCDSLSSPSILKS